MREPHLQPLIDHPSISATNIISELISHKLTPETNYTLFLWASSTFPYLVDNCCDLYIKW